MQLAQRLQGKVSPDSVEQEAWRSLFSELEAGRAEVHYSDGVFPLLWAIARRKLISHIRRETSLRRGAGAVGTLPEDEVAANAIHPISQLIVQEAIDALDDELQNVLGLLMHGYKAKEIAQKLGLSEPAVRRKIERIRARFRPPNSDEDS